LQRWEAFWEGRRDSVLANLNVEALKAGFRENAFSGFEEMLRRKWEVAELSHFENIKTSLAKNYLIEATDKPMVVNIFYVKPEEAEAVEAVLNSGDCFVPRNDGAEADSSLNTQHSSLSFAFDAGSLTRRMVASLQDSFNYVLWISGFIVFAFLLFSMGRIELTLISFAPLAVSWLWILGIMSLCDIRFNIVNIILATFIFGQGDDYTIFMTEGLMYEYASSRRMLASYRKSIAMSAALMFVGMGMLIFAKHPALRSLGEVTVIGMATVALMAFTLPPLLFRFLTMKKRRKRPYPLTLTNMAIMLYSFTIFLIMSLLITAAGFLMFSFGKGKPSEKKKLRFHTILQRCIKFLIHRIPLVKTTLTNRFGETFDKPAVIISNHQSHLDLACIMLLNPKILILTNDWVWNSPFYGRLIKYADYYPVSNGMESALENLRGAVERGYSVMVFPEGTRSADCTIGRFHRGAFWLAQQLGIDLLPVLLHGPGHVLPKTDFLLRKGQIHINILPRITPHDSRFGTDYSHRSREVRHYFQSEYAKLCSEYETPEYYADMVIHQYIYKGPSVERAVRRNLRRTRNYAAEIAAMPDEGNVEIQDAGYGEYPLLLALVKKRLQIKATDADADKLAIAANCAIIPENLKYIENE
jgi:1-acyl-sn-glycerol-3-phosphate acyltransferase